MTIPKAFAVGKYPVTFEDWDACALRGGCGGYKPSDQGRGRGQRPVINVNWQDAQAYIAWLNGKVEGGPYRLLSEAEWEYACRADSETAYCFGNDEKMLGDYGWFTGNSSSQTHPVGEKKPNKFGLYDMHGNVWEWCEDVWHASYKDKPAELNATGAAWTVGGSGSRVLRGGSWFSYPYGLNAAVRDGIDPVDRCWFIGFRLARTIAP